MIKRLLVAIVVVGLFFTLALQTPLENYVFQYKGSSPNTFPEINQIQVVDTAEEVKVIQKNKEADIHVNSSKPTKLEIPSLKISAPINEVGLTENGAMATFDSPSLIAWYKYGAIPGEKGNSILAGHKDWGSELGALFYLENMKVGETLIITYEDGSKTTFVLESNKSYLTNEVPDHVMTLSGDSRVTLITCTGKFDRKAGGYNSRNVALFKMVAE